MTLRNHYDVILGSLRQVFPEWQAVLDYESPDNPLHPVEVVLVRRGLHEFALQDGQVDGWPRRQPFCIRGVSFQYSAVQNVTYVSLTLATVAAPRELALN